MIVAYKNQMPRLSKTAFIAPSADIIGDVEVGELTGIWFQTLLRGDVAAIRVGSRTNIQDGTIVHVTRNGHPTLIGDGVTIGHRAMLHACHLMDHSFVGMSATIMDDAVIEPFSMVAAGALITRNKRVLTGEIWAGNPGKFFRKMTEQEKDYIKISEENYVKHAEEYIAAL